MFEVTYFFYERKEDGDYDKETKKEMKKKVGNIDEEVTLEKLANAILIQLARRDCWVTGVDIIEFTKTKISFKETKNGILIKNRKFTLTGEIEEEIPQPPQRNLPAIPQKRAMKIVLLDPEESTLRKIASKGLKLSKDKEYQVFQVRPGTMMGLEVYTMYDDNNREINVSSEYFTNKNVTYYRDDRRDGFNNQGLDKGPKLAYENEYLDEIVDVRKKIK